MNLELFKVLSLKPVIFQTTALQASPAGRKIWFIRCKKKSEVLFIPLYNGSVMSNGSDTTCALMLSVSLSSDHHGWLSEIDQQAERSRTMETSLRGFARRYLEQRWNLGQSPVRKRAGQTVLVLLASDITGHPRSNCQWRRGRTLALENQA